MRSTVDDCDWQRMPFLTLARKVNDMNAYCLFCNTQKREGLAETIRQSLDIEVIVPKIIQRKWVKGKSHEEVHDYLQGYLFLYADAPITDFSTLFHIDGVFRVLGSHDCDYRLSGSDLAFSRMLYDCNGVIGVLKTYREGDKVKIVKGAMGGFDGEIIRMDRRGRALVRFDFDGTAIQSWVAIEMVDDGRACVPHAPQQCKPTEGCQT